MTALSSASRCTRLVARATVIAAFATPADAQTVPPINDSPIHSYFLFDQLEHTTSQFTGGSRSRDALYFNTSAWIGGDYDRVWIYTEGNKTYRGKLEDLDAQVLYGRLIAPFWDIQGGVRYSKPLATGPSRNSAVFGVQGLVPYRFEVQAAAFVSNHGEVSSRVELEYELLLTQRWILQPRFETNIAFREVRELGTGRGMNDTAFGLRLRYEIKHEIAPYVGITWQQKYGGAKRLARERGESVSGQSLVAGIRVWF